jgi:hypothetical protein
MEEAKRAIQLKGQRISGILISRKIIFREIKRSYRGKYHEQT